MSHYLVASMCSFAACAACKSLILHRTGAALVPTALRLPPPVFLCGFAACLSVPKASKGSNAFYFTLVVEYQSLSKDSKAVAALPTQFTKTRMCFHRRDYTVLPPSWGT